VTTTLVSLQMSTPDASSVFAQERTSSLGVIENRQSAVSTTVRYLAQILRLHRPCQVRDYARYSNVLERHRPNGRPIAIVKPRRTTTGGNHRGLTPILDGRKRAPTDSYLSIVPVGSTVEKSPRSVLIEHRRTVADGG
jgi:hypothetical protein